MKLKHRMFVTEEVRAVPLLEGAGLPGIEGHAIVVGKRGETPWFSEEVAPEAVTKALADPNLDVAALWNHDASLPLGRTPDTLKLSQDDVGLMTRTSPVDTSFARDLVKLIGAGVVKQMSFGFYIRKEDVDDSGELPHFIIREIELFDVSPVTYPFYKQTDVQLSHSRALLDERLKAGRIELPAQARERIEHETEIFRRKLMTKNTRLFIGGFMPF